MPAKASGANVTPNGDAKHRAHHDGSAGRAYTVEQKTAVVRVRKCSPTAFYDILGLEEVRTTASDGDIKKAYRKLSLLTHPDKNGYEGADEAFKMVSRAFQVLSDPDKKAKYDKFGGDPDNRFGSASASSPFSGFGRSSGGGRGHPMFDEEISPEELFRQFFAGGMGGGMGGPFTFDTGPGFVFNLGGGPGIRVHQFGGQNPRRRPPDGSSTAQPASLSSALSSLLPLLLLFLLPLLSSLFSPSTPTGPSIRFDSPHPPYTFARTSGRLGVPYFVDPSAVTDYGTRQWRELDHAAESRYVGILGQECEEQTARRDRLLQEARGWFWIDEDKLRQARVSDLGSCKRLRDLGIRR